MSMDLKGKVSYCGKVKSQGVAILQMENGCNF